MAGGPDVRRRGEAAGKCAAAGLGLAALIASFATLEVSAAEAWSVTGDVWGKVKKNGSHELAEDVSGLACGPETESPRFCLLVDDESQGAQVLVLRGREFVAGDYIALISDTHDGKPVELDAEDVAYADGAFYVIGSHGRARHGNAKEEAENRAKAVASRRLFRVRFLQGALDGAGRVSQRDKVQIAASPPLTDVIQGDRRIGGHFDRPLDENGVTIEGLAAGPQSLAIGFRGPVVNGEATMLILPRDALFAGAPVEAESVPLRLGNDSARKARGVRALHAQGEGYLGIAGPVNDPPKGTPIACGDYAIFAWAQGEPVRLQELAPFAPATPVAREAADPIKPEGLTLLGSAGAGPVLLVFDGPPRGQVTEVQLQFDGRSPCRPSR